MGIHTGERSTQGTQASLALPEHQWHCPGTEQLKGWVWESN